MLRDVGTTAERALRTPSATYLLMLSATGWWDGVA